MYEYRIWDECNEEVSWDEIAHLDDSELTWYRFERIPIQPQNNTKENRYQSKVNYSKTQNSQSNTKTNVTNMRKPHMALHYKSKTLSKHLVSCIEGITPSKIPEDISSLFLEKIWNTMDKSIQNDIVELFEVYYIHQWTATSLMAVRLLENVLKKII